MAKEKTKKQHEPAKASNKVDIVGTRGRFFEGFVIKKFPMRVVIEFERTVYVHKFERFYKKKTKLHARLPQGLDINVGDLIRIQECRPLSKITHFVVISKVREAGK